MYDVINYVRLYHLCFVLLTALIYCHSYRRDSLRMPGGGIYILYNIYKSPPPGRYTGGSELPLLPPIPEPSSLPSINSDPKAWMGLRDENTSVLSMGKKNRGKTSNIYYTTPAAHLCPTDWEELCQTLTD
jgi:hypothetical protein